MTSAYDGEEGLRLARLEKPDLIVLDILLPKLDGLTFCRILRAESGIPIVMLTARAEEADKLVGLELGADDYITKPFSPRELVARIKTVLRRTDRFSSQELGRLIFDDLSIDFDKHQVIVGNNKLDLTSTEFQLLGIMAKHPGRVYSRLQLVDQIQGFAFEGYERTIDTHIKNLRKKIEKDPKNPGYIQTVHGVGYKFEVS